MTDAEKVAREIELVKRLRFLVSLNDAARGGPYQGSAAAACVAAMSEAADALTAAYSRGRREALEEAAKVAEKLGDATDDPGAADMCGSIAVAIRALEKAP